MFSENPPFITAKCSNPDGGITELKICIYKADFSDSLMQPILSNTDKTLGAYFVHNCDLSSSLIEKGVCKVKKFCTNSML